MELEIYLYWFVLKFFLLLNIRFRDISKPHKSPSKEENPLINSIDYLLQFNTQIFRLSHL